MQKNTFLPTPGGVFILFISNNNIKILLLLEVKYPVLYIKVSKIFLDYIYHF